MTKLQTKPPNPKKLGQIVAEQKHNNSSNSHQTADNKRISNKYNKRVAPNEPFNVIIVVGIKPSSDNLSKNFLIVEHYHIRDNILHHPDYHIHSYYTS